MPVSTNGNSVVYSATGLPSGWNISSSTGTITGPLTEALTTTVTITTASSVGSRDRSFVLTVAVNRSIKELIEPGSGPRRFAVTIAEIPAVTVAQAPPSTLINYPAEISSAWSTLGISLYQDNNGNYFSSANPDSYQTTSGAIAYSSPSALATGAGTQSDPKRLSELLNNNTIGVIYLAAGDYNNKWVSPVRRNLSVVCTTGKAYINRFEESITWASQGNNVWLAQGQTGNAGMVQDFSLLDSYGNPKKMELRNTLAEVQANANSFFLGSSGAAVYVRTFDNRAPDANIKLTKKGANGRAVVSNNSTMYFKNIVFNSGDDAFSLTGNSTGTAIFNTCTFRFGMGNSLSSYNNTSQLLFNCQAFHSRKDGFNYHVSSGRGRTYEEGCVARFNGVWANQLNAPKNNGSTTHDGSLIIRLNGTYQENQNRNVHDVSPNTLSYNVGCVAGQSLTPSTADESSAFSFGLFDETSTNAKAWYVGCSSSGGVKHGLQVYPGTTVTLVNSAFTSVLNQGTLLGGQGDVTAPALTGVSISAAQPARIVLQYNEALSTGNLPPTSAFTVPTETVSAVSISGTQVFVNVSAAFSGGQLGTISYTAPSSSAIQDAAGNKSVSFSNQSFSLPSTDTTAPVLTGVSVLSSNLSRIILQYGESFNTATVPAASAFTVPSKTVSAVSIVGAQVFVDVSVAYSGSESSSISYTQPASNALQDAAGNKSVSFSGQAFTIPATSGLDPAVQAFQTAVNSAGESVSAAEYTRLNNLVVSLKANGVWDRILTLWAPVGATLSEARRAIKHPLGSGTQMPAPNFVAADWNRTIGLDGRGMNNRSLDTGVAENTIPGIDSHIAVVVEPPVVSGPHRDIGVITNNSMMLMVDNNGGSYYRSYNFNTGLENIVMSGNTGMILGTRSGNSASLWRDGILQGSTAAAGATGSPSSNKINVYRARLDQANKIMSGASVGLGMTATQVQNFSAAMTAFRNSR